MAEEAVLVTETELPISFGCSATTTIEKGTPCKITDPMTASASTAANDLFAGIAAAEHIANKDGGVIPIYRKGIFRVYLSGSCTVGDWAGTAGTGFTNRFISNNNTVNLSGSKRVGKFLETGTTGEQVLMELNIN